MAGGGAVKQGELGPLKFFSRNGEKITVVDGPFVMRIFSSGPLRKMVVGDSQQSSPFSDEGRKKSQPDRGRNTDETVTV